MNQELDEWLGWQSVTPRIFPSVCPSAGLQMCPTILEFYFGLWSQLRSSSLHDNHLADSSSPWPSQVLNFYFSFTRIMALVSYLKTYHSKSKIIIFFFLLFSRTLTLLHFTGRTVMTRSLIGILRAGGQPGFCEEPLGPSAALAPSPGYALPFLWESWDLNALHTQPAWEGSL